MKRYILQDRISAFVATTPTARFDDLRDKFASRLAALENMRALQVDSIAVFKSGAGRPESDAEYINRVTTLHREAKASLDGGGFDAEIEEDEKEIARLQNAVRAGLDA
jgi:hypothetical protein